MLMGKKEDELGRAGRQIDKLEKVEIEQEMEMIEINRKNARLGVGGVKTSEKRQRGSEPAVTR